MRCSPLCLTLVVACAPAGGDGPAKDTDVETGTPTVDTGDGPAVDVVLPDVVARARRASMALRGIWPTEAELDTVAADPRALRSLAERWVQDDRFGELVRLVWADALRMRSTEVDYPAVGPLAGTTTQQRIDAVAEEPLDLIAEVVDRGLPFSTIVTADWTVLDRRAQRMWKAHTFDPMGEDVQVVTYTDGRPAGGILTTNGLWARHRSNGANHHRGRANLVADALLCGDFLSTDVPITSEVDLADAGAVADAIQEDPACAACHATLDPLASHLWTFHPEYPPAAVGLAYLTGCTQPFLELCYPFDPYRPEYAVGRPLLQLPRPAYFGDRTQDLGDLGAAIADDPRFVSCTVDRMWSTMAQVPLQDVPSAPTRRLRDRFEAADLDLRSLAVDLVLDPAFQGVDSPDPEVAATLPGPLLVRPDQHARLIAQLTGLSWDAEVDGLGCTVANLGCYGDVDLTQDTVQGFGAMTGGTDGTGVTTRTHTPTPVKMLLARALAEEAAAHVVRRELVRAEVTDLFSIADGTTADAPTVRRQLVVLHRRLLLEDVATDGPEVDATWALWRDARDRHDDPLQGWRAVLAAMLQSPSVLFH